MKIMFMGTPEISATCLKKLIDDGHDICAVITREDKPRGRGNVMTPTPTKQLATEHGIPTFTPRTLSDEAFAELLAQYDTYLDVFVAEMKYSDTPVTKSISEDLADIYQDVKNFVMQFQVGINETMHDAILECREHFRLYWGQTLVNTLRALHELEYNTPDDDANDENAENEEF